MNETFKKKIKKILTNQTIQMVITLGSVAVILMGAYITIRLAPLAQSLAVVQTIQAQQQINIQSIETNKVSVLQLKDDIDMINQRLNSIDANVRILLTK
jgi:hypothetical protein